MLPRDVETRIPPAILLTLMPPDPDSHCTPHGRADLYRSRHIARGDDAVGAIDDDLSAAGSGRHCAAGFHNVYAAAAGFGADRAADVAWPMISPPTVSISAAPRTVPTLNLPCPAGTAQRAAHRPDLNIAATGDQPAIAADAVCRQFTGAGIDFERAFDATGIHRAIGSGDHHVIQARRFHGDRGDHRTAGRGQHDPLALRRSPARCNAASRRALPPRYARGRSREPCKKCWWPSPACTLTGPWALIRRRRPAGAVPEKVAHETVALADHAAGLRRGRQRQQQQQNRECPKIYRAKHSCP